ncbi:MULTISPECIES: transporter substrate-binding domain-containing protein [Bifidobacterium]|jgi:ABC-type amino acid transport substrate-binding protein|nr:transporter substrate-binding domain-containing protein [Bifidobacterium tibiigranuli]MCI1211359.1 transporter substrate-binding domain-containing protein [Bifidobacterium tibiigranuli]MCI1222211.1 transporter substrate-binding domain-containing protein [Bifidobacterium tibiigranuli]MCI1233110.1 transporter substrate-binding domain-containing protein [Bifidobacterium tibiigranuli]MCI1254833.1 transporter substrate-binding domain-containing protein [Bifidobacterium tibiigranuli]
MSQVNPGKARRRKKTRNISILVIVVLVIALAGFFTVRSLNAKSDQGSATSASSSGVTADAALANDPAVKKLNGTISFGTEGTYSPFSYHDKNTKKLVGYDIEVAQAVADKLGVKSKFVETQFDGIFAGLESNHYDGIANQVESTPERQQKYELSDPYTVSYPVVITRSDNTSVTSIDDISGRTAAQTEGSNWNHIATEHGAKIQTVPGFSESMNAIEQKRVELTVNDKLAAKDYFKTTGNKNVKIAATDTSTKLEMSFAFNKGSGLSKPVNKALSELSKDGTLAKIGTKYFGEDVSK